MLFRTMSSETTNITYMCTSRMYSITHQIDWRALTRLAVTCAFSQRKLRIWASVQCILSLILILGLIDSCPSWSWTMARHGILLPTQTPFQKKDPRCFEALTRTHISIYDRFSVLTHDILHWPLYCCHGTWRTSHGLHSVSVQWRFVYNMMILPGQGWVGYLYKHINVN